MPKGIWLSLLLLLAPVQASTATPDGVYETLLTLRIDGDIGIGQDGHVLTHKFDTPLEPELRALLDRAVPKWTFHPVELDGKPAVARSKMRVTLGAKQVASGYQVWVDNVLFHDGKDTKDATGPGAPGVRMKVARRTVDVDYPKYVVNGVVVVTVLLSPAGTVDDILATQTTFLNAQGTPAEFDRARRSMEENAVKAIGKWRYEVEVPTGLTPRPEQLTGAIQVRYRWNTSRRDTLENAGQWRHETRTAQQRVPWIIDTQLAQQIRASDMDDSADMFPSATALRLRDGVIGKAL